MALIIKRSIMTLFSKPACPECHRVRLVLAEKGINHEVIYIAGEHMPEDLLDLNPYHSVPTLVDRDLVLYDARVIMEYLDERFPHPPLMPVDPVSRAKFRLTMFRIEREWYQLVQAMQVGREESAYEDARRLLRERLISSAEVFLAKPFFLSTEFSLVDCTIAPILWRLSSYDIDLPAQAKPILRYAERIFSRPGFKGSLSSLEKAMC